MRPAVIMVLAICLAIATAMPVQAINNVATAAATDPRTGKADAPAGQVEKSAEPAFALNDSVVKLQPGAPAGGDTMLLLVTGDEKLLNGTLSAKDMGYPSAPAVKLPIQTKRLGGQSGRESWLLQGDVKDFAYQGTQTRYLELEYRLPSKVIQARLPYTIDNAFPTPFTWRVVAPPATGMAWSEGTELPVMVSVTGSVPAQNVRLVSVSLVDAQSLRAFANSALHLCPEPKPCKDEGIDLAAGSTTKLYIVADARSVSPGTFQGKLALAATQAAPESFDLIIHHTTAWRMMLGAVTIALGVLLGWFVSVYLRHALVRAQLTTAAARLRSRFKELGTRLAGHNGLAAAASTTRTKITDAATDLDEKRLVREGLIPARVPLPWQDVPAAVRNFSATLTSLDAVADGLTAVVQSLESVVALDAAGVGNAHVLNAVKAIDALAQEAGVTSVVEIARKAIAQVNTAAAALGFAGDAAPPRFPAFQRIGFEVSLLSAAAWALILLFTVLTGVGVLVLSDHGFGQPIDYLVCLLWGLGLSAAGSQLQTIGAGTVSQTFSVGKGP